MNWKRKVVSCLVAASFSFVTPMLLSGQSPSQNSAARALFGEGRNLWDQGNFVDAERKFREALTKFPRAEQADRTAYYLITTLMKLGRTTEARTEIESFYKNYPQSSWKSDVEEKRLTLSGLPTPLIARAHGEPGYHFGEPIFLGRNSEARTYSPINAWAGSPSLEQEVLRLIIEMDPNRGIETARERLKTNSSDPAVVANLGAIAVSHSSQALPFLVTLAGSAASSPNVRSQAVFWLGRHHAGKDVVGKAFIEVLKEKGSDTVVAEAIGRFSPAQRLVTLDQIAQSQNVDRVSMLERIYQSSNNTQVRAQVVQTAASVTDPAAPAFLTGVFRNDKEVAVRRAAAQALAARKDVDVNVLLEILNSMRAGSAK